MSLVVADAYFGRHAVIIERRKEIYKTNRSKPPLEPSRPAA
jgi:hypothetical protein